MTCARIRLPDELYQQAMTLAAKYKTSLAEMTRRSFKLLLSRFPETTSHKRAWKLPSGGAQDPLDDLYRIAVEEQGLLSCGERENFQGC